MKSLRQIARRLASIAREIFDEAAYARFLARRKLPASRQAYSEFQKENDLARARRPRCC